MEKKEHKMMLNIPMELWQRLELARVLTLSETGATTLQKKEFICDMIIAGLDAKGKENSYRKGYLC